MDVAIISVALCVVHMVLVLWFIGEDGASANWNVTGHQLLHGETQELILWLNQRYSV